MSTQKYIDGERGWIDSLLNETPIIEGKKVLIEPVIDIDPDIFLWSIKSINTTVYQHIMLNSDNFTRKYSIYNIMYFYTICWM